MLDKLLKISGAVALYGCTSLFLASLLLAAYLKYAWRIDNAKWTQMLAIAQGHDLFGLHEKVEQRIAEMSFEEVLQIRAKRLREEEFAQETGKPSETLPGDEIKINEKLKEIKDSREALDKYIDDRLDKYKEAGLAEETRLIEEEFKPEFAKDVILNLIKEHGAVERVLVMLLRMDDRRRGEILARMQKEPELKELCNLLQRIGNGEPFTKVIEDARKNAEQ